MKCVWLWAALGAASGIAGAGCGDPTTTGGTPLNLVRPIDVAFACFGAMRQTGGRAPGTTADPVIATAQPPAACQALSPPLTGDAKTPVPGQETLSDGKAIVPAWYSFILQSSSGTVALATWGAKPAEDMEAGVSDNGGEFKVLDGDPLTPGKNAISVGEDPIAIATDKAGCFAITANAGSCDLSSIDINSVLDDIQPVEGKPTTPAKVDRLRVTNATAVLTDAVKGVILARPAAMVAEPSTTVVGNACPATATGKMFIAYPGCHLVAGVDTATGKIVSGIQFDAAGAATILSGAALDNLTCPDECTNALGARGNGAVMAGVRPVALDLRFDPRVDASKPAATSRLAIGAENSSSLTLVELDPATSAPVSVLQIPLENKTGKLGVTEVALSPQIGMGGNAADGNNPVGDATSQGGQGQYIYAVATDGTVRVADVLDQKRECDTQLDGRFVRTVSDPKAMQCFPIGDPARPRRSAARGPGIELPFDAVATSVAIVKGRNLPPPVSATNTAPQPPAPAILLGHFAVITSSSGLTYVANIDDDYAPDVFSTGNPLGTQPVLTMAHQLRDGFFSRSEGPQTSDPTKKKCTSTDPLSSVGGAIAGGPRPLNPPARNAPTGSIDLTKVLPLPSFLQVGCTLDQKAETDPLVPVSELEFGAPESTRDQVYPDLATVQTETWRLTWEGQLSLDNGTTAVDGPPVRSGQLAIDSTGMRMIDPARPFCELGVEPFDIVDIRGCSPSNGDTECPAGYTCFVHPKSVGVGVGACMLKSEAPRLADACFGFLTTQRRYTVSRVEPGQIRLLERWHELQNAPIDGCVDDNQCDLLAQDADKIDGLADPFTARTHWSCRTDPLRAPISADPARNKRCVQMCSTDPAHPWDCASGTICQLLAPGGTDGICMEGVAAPQSCVNGPQRYDVRASEAFTVIGTRSGYVHPIVENNGACVVDPSASPVQRGRIPLKAPACDPTANPITGKLPGGGFEANPCALSVMQFDTVAPNPTPACAAQPPAALGEAKLRDAQALKFRNRAMALTVVDPFQVCLPNGQGAAANVPLVDRGFELVFAQKAGYVPFTLPVIGPSYPVKVVRGPTDSIWVIDDGDFLSSSILLPSTQGRVFRIEAIDVNRVSVIQ